MLYIAYAVLWLLRFALGACVFSFLGVVVWRLPRRESVVKGRSHCPACGRTLSAAELIPCLSYLLQGGKCRGCGAKIPARDFWIEVLGGLCSCACAYAFGGESAQAALAFVVLFTLSTTNISERERELATIKVLGFRRREVYRYINKETVILTLVGIVAGFPLGYAITRALTVILRMPSLYFDTLVELPTYAIAAAMSLLFTLIINAITNRSLDRVDMVGALKSAE